MTTDPESVLTQLRKGVLEYCVLAILERRPSYGLEMTQQLSSHPALMTTAGSLYPLLSRMRKQGRVETFWEESPSGPPRQYYKLSASGKTALRTFEAAWHPFVQDVDSILGESK